MGMYTVIKFSAALNDVGREVVDFLENSRASRQEYVSDWQAAADRFGYPWLKRWAEVDRCDFIPWGAYVPGRRDVDDIGHQHVIVTKYYNDGRHFNYILPERSSDGSTWHVCADLKNYEGEIQTFCEHVLPYMISLACPVYHEYEGRRYDYVDPTPEYDIIIVLPKE